ncbi:GNAT family N-acetyltransferase [Isoptericola variabilis]|uniref:GCN5-related N-acetyltransferase n=1 Tax=Isoptericola variabilis (strain 225) TaxID=743718 RepID=F6FPI4_ISOV2|nr:GNAT family N-acetyltransferase [Isoptericola variabilis]AEG43697.1 GCN5-related N-acetyltransferase [Isoptericola variabilis 225]
MTSANSTPLPAPDGLPLGGPAGLPEGWSSTVPDLADVPRLAELRGRAAEPHTGSAAVDAAALAAEVAGPKSWTRRQLVVRDPAGAVRAWVRVHDRAAGRVVVDLDVDRTIPAAERVAASCYAWAERVGRELAAQRGLTVTQLDAGTYAGDEAQRRWLADAGYAHVRSWLQMSRPVSPEEAAPGALPGPRPGVTVRPVATHETDVPVADDLQTVHRVLESAFADHFNSYRESFPEFVQRLREDPGHRWDHWWLAFVDDPENPGAPPVPAGALVGAVLPAGPDGKEGSYVEYLGATRVARGRGVATALLLAVVQDAAARGRDRVGLEVDADSPTGAHRLYERWGWSTKYVTESWHKDVAV